MARMPIDPDDIFKYVDHTDESRRPYTIRLKETIVDKFRTCLSGRSFPKSLEGLMVKFCEDLDAKAPKPSGKKKPKKVT